MLCGGGRTVSIDCNTVTMAKSQPPCSETSLKEKKRKLAVKESCVEPDVIIKKKKKRKKTQDEETEACTPSDDATNMKKKKADDSITTVECKKRSKKRETKSKSSDEAFSPAEAEKTAEEEKDRLDEEAMEGVEDLSPDEMRVLERKMKKIRGKEEKKKMKEKGKTEKEESKTSIAQTQALEYLTCWSEKREEWKFQKSRQVWLLQHMYDSEKVPDGHFAVLLSYLEGLQGGARETTVQKAEALVRWGGQEAGEAEAEEAQMKAYRAKEVIQILS